MGGSAFSCLKDQTSIDDAPQYDLSVIQSKNLPFIWITGQQNTGKKTHGELIKERFDFDHINITDLLRNEATKDTNRGKIVGDCLRLKKRVNDNVVMQLLKEALVNSTNDNGFVISNFPKNSKQADMFIKEIQNVNFILYLYSDIVSLLNRAQAKAGRELDETILKKDIAYATRDIKSCLQKFVPKIENINTTGAPEIVFNKIQSAIVNRLRIQAPPSDMLIESQPDSEVGSNEPLSAVAEKPADKPNVAEVREDEELKSDEPESNNLKNIPSEEAKGGSLNSELLYEDPSSRISQISENANAETKVEEPKIEFHPVTLEVDTSDPSDTLSSRLPSKNIRIDLPVVQMTVYGNAVLIGDNEIDDNIKKRESLKIQEENQIENNAQKEEFLTAQNETPNSEITSDSIPQSESLSDIPSNELVQNTDTNKIPNEYNVQNDLYEDKPPAYTPYDELLTDNIVNKDTKNNSIFEHALSDNDENKTNQNSLQLPETTNSFVSNEEYAKTMLSEEIPRLAYDVFQVGQVEPSFLSELAATDEPEELKERTGNNDLVINDPEQNKTIKENSSSDIPHVTDSNNTNTDYEI